jgi:hypothetical protein
MRMMRKAKNFRECSLGQDIQKNSHNIDFKQANLTSENHIAAEEMYCEKKL